MLPINAVILQRNGSGLGQNTHPRTKQFNPPYLYQAELSAVVDSRLPDGLK